MMLSKEDLKQADIALDNFPGFGCFGLVGSTIPNTLTYLDDKRFIDQTISNPNISIVLTNNIIADLLSACTFEIIICSDPRYSFFQLYNILGKKYHQEWESEIDTSANIHPSAIVSPTNVRIGARTVIEPNAIILKDVIIGMDCIIRAGCVVGSEGFEYKRTSKGILPVYHDRLVIIGNQVHLGANNTVAKGIMSRDTKIGDETKTDNLVHIAHGSQIGDRCFLAAGAIVAGSVTMGNDVWVGPNATVSNLLTIGDRAFITIGSVVTKDVHVNEKVTGNFAIPHVEFMENLKKSTSRK